jgi:hypothetical protein
MIDAGTFYVVTIGRMYAREDAGIWTHQLSAAAKYKTLREAKNMAKAWGVRADGHVPKIQRITIETLDP